MVYVLAWLMCLHKVSRCQLQVLHIMAGVKVLGLHADICDPFDWCLQTLPFLGFFGRNLAFFPQIQVMLVSTVGQTSQCLALA